MDQKYPTREQSERIASNDCAHEICHTCDIEKWCAGTTDDLPASVKCGESMLAMHDEIDRLKAELEQHERKDQQGRGIKDLSDGIQFNDGLDD